MKWSLQKIVIHTLCWVAFVLLPIIVSPDFSIFNSWEIGKPDIRNLISSLLLIPFFYLNYQLLIPELYQQKKYLFFIALSIVAFIVITVLPSFLLPDQGRMPIPMLHRPDMPPPMEMHGIRQHQPPHEGMFPFQIESNFLKFFIVFVLSILLKESELWKKAQDEKKKAELSYLKLQVNPHFLFNTLNSIYSLSLEKSDKTPSAIVKLSELMRYVTSEVNEDYVPLAKEVNYISNYIDLQRIRLGETVAIDFSIVGNIENQEIAPLILIPFVENAFKFGVNPEESSYLRINLIINEEGVTLSVYNKKVKLDHHVKTNGTGLKNVRQRLALIYPTTHSLSIRETERDFTVELTLQPT
jgi:hypothetical protein